MSFDLLTKSLTMRADRDNAIKNVPNTVSADIASIMNSDQSGQIDRIIRYMVGENPYYQNV